MFGRLFGIDPCDQGTKSIDEHVQTPIPEICKHCQYGLTRGQQKKIAKAVTKGEVEPVSPTFKKAFAGHAAEPLIELGKW